MERLILLDYNLYGAQTAVSVLKGIICTIFKIGYYVKETILSCFSGMFKFSAVDRAKSCFRGLSHVLYINKARMFVMLYSMN